MRLRYRVQILFVVLALLVIVDVGFDRYLVGQRDDLRREVTQQWEPARSAVGELLFALTDQEAGLRGYLITGDDGFLEPYRSGGQEADEAIAALDDLVGDEPDAAAQLRRTV